VTGETLGERLAATASFVDRAIIAELKKPLRRWAGWSRCSAIWRRGRDPQALGRRPEAVRA
jgi:hypothetical protein